MKENQLTICVAIPTYLRENILLQTIEQALAQVPPADEILVIDQTPEHEPETLSALQAWHDLGKIQWIQHSPPNLPSARNRAIKETTCDVVIFIDDDVILSDGFVGKHLKNYNDNPRVDAVSGRAIQEGWNAPVRSKPWPTIMDYRFLSRDSKNRKEGIASFPGCNHSVRVSAINHIGGYDKNYIGWAYREESDAAIRLWKTGGLIVHDPEASLIHLAFPSGGCRLKVNQKPLPEWQISFPANYFAVRHLFPSRWFWYDILLVNPRQFIFRKDNFFKPWRLPWAVGSYLYSIFKSAVLIILKY